MYCKCEHTKCSKAADCKRINGQAVVVGFKNICNEENDFKWYIKDKSKLPTTEVTTEDNNQ
jgi:hypothetical protein